MDALGDILAPYSHTIAKIAGTITLGQFLSGGVLINDIRKRQSSDVYPPGPFLGGIALTVVSLLIGLVSNDAPMTRTNLIGLAINAVFLYVFYYYASKGKRDVIHKQLGYVATFLAAVFVYAAIDEPKNVEFRLGLLVTGILLFLVGGPLLHVNKIIEKKSTEGMPFPIIFTGTLVSASWMFYGISIKNTVLIYQNMLMFVLSSIQLSFFAIYPNTPPVKKTQKSNAANGAASNKANSTKKSASPKKNK